MNVLLKLVVLSSLLTGPIAFASPLDAYYSQINYSCSVDTDCEVQNVGNCCGYYPRCVNTKAKVDPDLANLICQKEGIASACGFAEIDTCKCIKGQCAGSFNNTDSQDNILNEIPIK